MRSRSFVTESPEETEALGERLGELLQPPALLLLRGELGAGKTCLVRGLARGLGVPTDEPVASPTYALMHQYRGRCDLYHFDLYRLSGSGELEEIGFDDYAEAHGVTVVEWSERAERVGLAGLRIELRVLEDSGRRSIEMTPGSDEDERLLARLALTGEKGAHPAATDRMVP